MSDNENNNDNDLIAQRRAHLQKLREKGNAYPNHFRRSALAAELLAEYTGNDQAELEQLAVKVKIAGRMMTRRVMGKAAFATIQDMSGKIQLYVARDGLPEGVYDSFKHWDFGDIIGASGIVFKTKTHELSVKVDQLRLLTKSLRPLPDKFHGLSDQEQRFRQRYVDLIVNDEARNIFYIRSKIVAEIRKFLEAQKFMEVE